MPNDASKQQRHTAKAMLLLASGGGLTNGDVCCCWCMQNFQVFGYARSKMTDAEFRDMITSTLTCRVNAR